jgi:hypothetical protein
LKLLAPGLPVASMSKTSDIVLTVPKVDHFFQTLFYLIVKYFLALLHLNGCTISAFLSGFFSFSLGDGIGVRLGSCDKKQMLLGTVTHTCNLS